MLAYGSAIIQGPDLHDRERRANNFYEHDNIKTIWPVARIDRLRAIATLATDVAHLSVSMVCLSVCVGHMGEPCNKAEPIEVPFGGSKFRWVEVDLNPYQMGLYMGTIWRIQLNDPRSCSMGCNFENSV